MDLTSISGSQVLQPLAVDTSDDWPSDAWPENTYSALCSSCDLIWQATLRISEID